jgi:hypothetical protein
MKLSGMDVRRWLLIGVAAYLLGGALYVAAGALKNRNESRFGPGWAEPFASVVGVLFWPWLLGADWKHKVGVFAPDSVGRAHPVRPTPTPDSTSR